jgi:hypothetical protein
MNDEDRAKDMVAKMRASTERQKRKVWSKPIRLSRKKVSKARQKKNSKG